MESARSGNPRKNPARTRKAGVYTIKDLTVSTLGNLVPILGWGRFGRITACNLETGRTELRVKVLAYGLAAPGVVGPQNAVDDSRKMLAEVRSALAAALDGDLK